MAAAKKEITKEKATFDSQISKKAYDKAADTAVNIGEAYRNQLEDNEKAYKYYEIAKECISKVSKKSDAVMGNEFFAYRASFETFCEIYEDDKIKIKEALEAFLNYVAKLNDLSYKQIALHIASQTYFKYLFEEENDLEIAKKYAMSSLKYLDEYGQRIDEILKKRYNLDKEKFENDDSKRRRAGQYQVLANIAEVEGNLKAAEDYCNKALEYPRLEKDHHFHFLILTTQRGYVGRQRQHEISKRMLEVLGKMTAKERTEHLLETQTFYANDCLIIGDLEEAGSYFWKIYNSSKANRDSKEETEKKLIKLHKIRLRSKEVSKLERIQPLDYCKMAKMYEKIADDLCELEAYEFAIEFYTKMKQAASLLPGDPEFGDLEISRAAVLSIAQTYARDLKEYEVALKYYEQLRRILIQLKSSKVHLAENRLDVALSKMECHHLFSFEEQKDAFEKVEMPKDDIVLYVKYLEGYIDFLNGHKNREGVLDILNDLNSELLKYSSFQSDSQEDPPTTSSQDQFDLLSDKEIFQKVKDYYKVEEEVEEKKRKIKLKNKHGENLLHEAAKESLKKVKFLIERCGYKLVINEKDNSNWTPLSEAVSHGHLDIVEYLIEHGAEMNTISKEALVDEDDKDCTGSNISPLMEACHNGFYNIICALIRNKADQCLMNQNGWTAGDYLEGFMKSSLMDKSEKAKFLHILKVLRANEAKDERIKNREKRNDLPNAPPKKELPKLRTRPQEKSGGEMLKEAVAGVGRRNNFQRFAPPPISRKYNSKNNDDDDRMLEDEDFLAPESDEDDEMCDKKGGDSDDAMEMDDNHFRQNHGFSASMKSSSTPIPKRHVATPKRSAKKSSSSRIENDENDDCFILSQDSEEEEKSSKKSRKSRHETLKRRSSNRSFESSSSSSKKTKRSESISKDSDILSLTKMVDMNSLSLTQQRFNVEAKELDLSFSESVSNVSVTLNLHQYLTKLCLKGSDFDDDITEVVDEICACSKLVELDLSQVEQIQSIHANKILKSCLKLKILDLYGTSVKVLDLQGKYVLEHLNISKTPFEFSDGFYQQINDLQTLSFLDVSLTAVDMNALISTISPSRLKISIKAAPILSHINLHQLSTILSRFTMGQIKIKFSSITKEELLNLNPTLQNFLI